MLAIIVSYHSFQEFLPLQLQNIQTFVKVPYHVYVVDNSNTGELTGLQFPHCSILRNPELHDSPSGRHQTSVNLGLQTAWNHSDDFLIFDNDMIFLTEWNPPQEDLWYGKSKRGNWDYCWMNLLYMKKFQPEPFVFYFYTCEETMERTDSGGTSGFLLKQESLTKCMHSLVLPPERNQYLPLYQERITALCHQYDLPCWIEVHSLNGTKIFHFRAMSNYHNWPQEFMNKKKQLILDSV